MSEEVTRGSILTENRGRGCVIRGGGLWGGGNGAGGDVCGRGGRLNLFLRAEIPSKIRTLHFSEKRQR